MNLLRWMAAAVGAVVIGVAAPALAHACEPGPAVVQPNPQLAQWQDELHRLQLKDALDQMRMNQLPYYSRLQQRLALRRAQRQPRIAQLQQWIAAATQPAPRDWYSHRTDRWPGRMYLTR